MINIMKDNKRCHTKIETFCKRIKAEAKGDSLFGIIYGAGLILAFLSVLSAILFIVFGD